ncbi:MAG TPA: hypothetical protein VHG91_08215 [Longimicrobium sp.]|nr:hypothetical protein [Longimicrobium sp.]
MASASCTHSAPRKASQGIRPCDIAITRTGNDRTAAIQNLSRRSRYSAACAASSESSASALPAPPGTSRTRYPISSIVWRSAATSVAPGRYSSRTSMVERLKLAETTPRRARRCRSSGWLDPDGRAESSTTKSARAVPAVP